MFVIITYDVSITTERGQKRLRNVAKYCENIGQRVQNSVFECIVDYSQYNKIISELSKLINKKTDSLRFYNLGNKWSNKVTHIGIKESIDVEKGSIIL